MVAPSRATPGDGDDALVLDLADVSADRVAAVGGKAANLGELIRAGFDVPPGFCVTTEAYRRAVRGTAVESGTGMEAPAAPPTQHRATRPAAGAHALPAPHASARGTAAAGSRCNSRGAT